MKLAKRIEKLPPYLFAEICKKIAAKRAQGVDVVTFAIGDPDIPTPPHIIDALVTPRATRPTTATPSRRACRSCARPSPTGTSSRFGLTFDPEKEVLPLIGSKEGIAHIALCFIDPGDVALVPDPGYPVYAIGTMFAGGEQLLPAAARGERLPARLRRDPRRRRRRARSCSGSTTRTTRPAPSPTSTSSSGRRLREEARHRHLPRRPLQRGRLRRLQAGQLPPGARRPRRRHRVPLAAPRPTT